MHERPFDRPATAPPWRLRIVALACLLLAAACARDEERMNVLLITLDTTRADALSCYGAPAGSTPNLDALAAAGARFDCAISVAAVTPVSHATILSGLEPKEHGLRVLSADGGYRLPERVPTLATLLHDAGWSTAAVHSAFPVSSHFGFQRGFEVFESLEGRIDANAERDGWDVGRLQRRSDETSTRVLADLAARRPPWFLWIHYWDPHDDARVPPDTALPKDVPRRADGHPAASRELYAAEVRYMDAQIGRVFDALRESGAWERTLVVVVSDHGEGLGDHGWQFHRVLYQEQIRVPLIVRVPGETSGSTHAELVRTSDIAPTVLDYLGRLDSAPRMSGKSVRALLEGRAEPPRIAYADQINGYDRNAGLVRTRPNDAFLYCAMSREWKLVWRPLRPELSELFHLRDDPRELANVFRRDHPQVAELGRALAERNGWVLAPFVRRAGESNPAGADGALDSLGYSGGEIEGPDLSGWAWTCPAHPDVVLAERGACPRCQAPPLLVRKP